MSKYQKMLDIESAIGSGNSDLSDMNTSNANIEISNASILSDTNAMVTLHTTNNTLTTTTNTLMTTSNSLSTTGNASLAEIETQTTDLTTEVMGANQKLATLNSSTFRDLTWDSNSSTLRTDDTDMTASDYASWQNQTGSIVYVTQIDICIGQPIGTVWRMVGLFTQDSNSGIRTLDFGTSSIATNIDTEFFVLDRNYKLLPYIVEPPITANNSNEMRRISIRDIYIPVSPSDYFVCQFRVSSGLSGSGYLAHSNQIKFVTT